GTADFRLRAGARGCGRQCGRRRCDRADPASLREPQSRLGPVRRGPAPRRQTHLLSAPHRRLARAAPRFRRRTGLRTPPRGNPGGEQRTGGSPLPGGNRRGGGPTGPVHGHRVLTPLAAQQTGEDPVSSRSAAGKPVVMTHSPTTADTARLLAELDRHLRVERGCSPHTVRAYLTDVRSLLDYLADTGAGGLEDLDLATLRGWLGTLHDAGASRATMARRTAAARVFTAYLHRSGRLATDPGLRLATPRRHRRLPAVLDEDQAARVCAAARDGEESPLVLRRSAVVEVLYSTAIRVAELCGLDLDDVDWERHTLRVLGKGGRERVVPIGVPALDAVDRWLRDGRPQWATAHSG